MLRFRLFPVLALCHLCWLPLAIAETDSTAAPLKAKKPQHAEFEQWRSILTAWRARRDQLRTARVKVIGEEQSFYREQQAKGEPVSLIFRKIFELNGQLDQGNDLQKWTTTDFDVQNEIHAQLSQAERARFLLRNGIPSTLSRPQRIWKMRSNSLRSLFYWNPLYAGFNQFSLAGRTYNSQTEADRWYKGFLDTGITDQRDSITFRKIETGGLLLVKLKRFCSINHKPGIVVSELCFNERQGFTLLSHKRWLYYEEQKQPELPFRDVTVNWKQVDSVWVPTSMTTVTNYGLHVTSLKLEWSHLNKPLKQSDPPNQEQNAPLDWSKIMLL